LPLTVHVNAILVPSGESVGDQALASMPKSFF
jgi:hypothetical protein